LGQCPGSPSNFVKVLKLMKVTRVRKLPGARERETGDRNRVLLQDQDPIPLSSGAQELLRESL